MREIKWEKKRLGQIANVTAGQSAPRNNTDFGNDGLPFIRAGHLEQLISGLSEDAFPKVTPEIALRYRLKQYPKYSVVFAKSGMSAMLNRVYKLKVESYVVSHLAIIPPNDKYDSTFLTYLIQEKKPSTLIKDEAYPSISLSDINQWEMKLPPIDDQRYIADTLNKASGLIALRKKQLEELDALAEAVFYDMFGDPVKNENGWKCASLGDLGHFKNGLNYRQVKAGNALKILGISDFRDNKEIREFSNLSIINVSDSPNKDYFLKNEDIVFVRSNGSKELVGRSLLVYPNEENISFSGFCIRFRKNTDAIHPLFLIQILSNPNFKRTLFDKGRGCNINNVNQQMLSSLCIPVPPPELQIRYVKIIEKIEEQKSLVRKALKESEDLFQRLLQDLLNPD